MQLVKKFPAFHGTRRFITALTSLRHLSLSCAGPIQSIYPHPTSWRSVLILSTHLCLGLPSGLSLRFPHRDPIHPPLLTHTCHMPSPSHSSRFCHPQNVYRHEVETRLSHKPWKQEIAKIPDWPRGKAVAEFRLCVERDCLGTHLHCTGIRPDPYCMLCSLHEPMDRNHLGQCTTLLNGTDCE